MKLFALSCLALCLTGAGGVVVMGQGAIQGAISPFPAWPPDGNIPESLQNNYVFLGPRMGQIVVSYPASLESPNLAGRKTFTFELHSQVEPTVSIRMTRGSNGLYVYDYSVHNGQAAKQAIRTSSFVGPLNDKGFSASRRGWTASKTPTASTRQLALPTVKPQLGAAVFFHVAAGNEIQPGGTVDEFHVTSTYSPGFTTAFVKSGSVFDLPAELPTAVGDQVGILAKQWDSKVVLILGPKFAPESSIQAIAADFHVGMSQLIHAGALSGDSPFVKVALSALARSIESGGTSTVAEIASVLPKPSPGMESEIAVAMKISLSYER